MNTVFKTNMDKQILIHDEEEGLTEQELDDAFEELLSETRPSALIGELYRFCLDKPFTTDKTPTTFPERLKAAVESRAWQNREDKKENR